jgi:RNA polymerase sigma-70 factor (ECF subfamily)
MVSTSSMSLLIRQTPHSIVEAPMAQPNPPDGDAEARRIATAVGRGDEAAFRDLYERYRQRLFRFSIVLGRGDESLAHDVVQNVFVTAAAKLRRAENEEHLWNWLARVARQHIAKTRRQKQRDIAMIGMAEIPECLDADKPDSILEESLDSALLAMDAEDRRLIEMFYCERLSQKEIAVQLDATPKAISSRLERARAKLRLFISKNLSHEN